MNTAARRTIIAAAVVAALAAPSVQAAIIRASAGLGTVDSPADTIGGIGEQVRGFRFTLDNVVQVEQVGGRLWGWGRGEIFAAIVPLSGPDGMPSLPFEETILARVLFDPPLGPPAVDWRIPMSIKLDPGGYALIFGPWGATSDMQMPVNNPPLVGPESMIVFGNFLDGWTAMLSADQGLPRFVVEGVVIPEPSMMLLAAVAAMGLLGLRIRQPQGSRLMTITTSRTILAAFVVVALAASPTRGAIIHESATLGPTGLTGIGWPIVAEDRFLGSRFTLTRPVEVISVGGHLAQLSESDKFFAALTALTGPTGFPISGTSGLPSMDAYEDWTPLATALFELPTQSSTDVLVPMSITLGPGDYGLVFGSYLFGATPSAVGTMPANNHAIAGHESYFTYSPFIREWRNSSLTNVRFVVTGRVIPEPNAEALAIVVMGVVRIATRGASRRGGVMNRGASMWRQPV